MLAQSQWSTYATAEHTAFEMGGNKLVACFYNVGEDKRFCKSMRAVILMKLQLKNGVYKTPDFTILVQHSTP